MTTPRAALYARFSTDMQNPASIGDQLHAGRRHAEKIGAQVVEGLEFSDAGISGQTMAARPGLLALLEAARARKFDVLIAEHTDRISRSGADGWSIYEDLKALGIAIDTVNQGRIAAMHMGMASTMSVMFIEELAKKTRRGLEGVARSGRVAATAYGYRVALAYDAAGERIRGLREIDPDKAAIVVRIFEEYLSGISPEHIAGRLNAEGLPAPQGRLWCGPTIRGSPYWRTGLLNNDLYRGKLVWGRATHHKNRQTGKTLRGPKLAPVEDLVERDVPELRIIPDDLWNAVQARQESMRRSIARPEQARRPKRLLSGLVMCSGCNRPLILSAGDPKIPKKCARWVCRSNRTYGPGTCTAAKTPKVSDVDARVLGALSAQLLHPEAVEAYVREYRSEMARRNHDVARAAEAAGRDLAKVDSDVGRLVDQLLEHGPSKAVADRLAALEARRADLQARIDAAPKAEVIALHPEAAGRYRKAVMDLQADLDGPDTAERAHARETLRAFIKCVRIVALDGPGQYRVEIEPRLAGLFPGAETDAETAVRLIA